MKSLKTPLRYPGGKSRACTKMDQYFPDLRNYNEYREPFLGGGSVALHVTKKYPDIKVWVNDLYEPLVNFWIQLRDNPHEIKRQLQELKQRHPDPVSAKVLFEDSKRYLSLQKGECDDTVRAVSFYIVNKCSFSGLTESSSFSKQASDSNFSLRGIEKLPEYSEIIQNWVITNLTYERMSCDEKDVFTYLDPPYEIKSSLYGKKGGMHKGFDHDAFAEECDRHTNHMMISYNSSQLIRDRFKEWTPSEFDHTYTMRSVGDYMKEQQERKELVLTNYAI